MTIRCQENGHWSHEGLSCDVGRCAPVEDLPNASPSTRLAVNNTINIYQCDYGHVFGNSRPWIPSECNGISWNNTEPGCHKVKCPDISVEHAQVSVGGTSYGDTVHVTCDEGYIWGRNISHTITCQATGTWEPNITECIPIVCGDPPEVLNAWRAMQTAHTYLQSLKYTCYLKTWLARGLYTQNTVCTKHGVWANVITRCSEIGCPAVPTWEGLTVNTTQTSVGTYVNVSCEQDAGHVYIISVCTDTGDWLPPVTTCKTAEPTRFEPERQEADGSAYIGIVITSVIGSLFIAVIISDVPMILKALLGQLNAFKL